MPRRSPARPRTKPPELRREELMAAAERLFVAKGVAATTIDDIVARAGVAKGTFYLYFAAKEDVIAALRTRFIAAFRARVAAATEVPPRGDWHGRLAAWIEAGVRGYLDSVTLHDVVFHGVHADRDSVKFADPVVAHLAALLDAGTRAGAWRVRDARLTALVIFHGLHGAADDLIARGARRDGRDGRALARALARLVGVGIAESPPRGRRTRARGHTRS